MAGGPRLQQRLSTTEGSQKMERLREFEQVLLQMVYSRAVDNFLTYLSELVTLIFKSRPGTPSSSQQQVSIERILQYGSMDELIAALTEERVTALAYQGMTQLSDDLKSRLKFEPFEQKQDPIEAVRITEVRNLIVHNHAIINNIFVARLARVGITTYTVGEGISSDAPTVRKEANFLFERVLDVDRWAVAKFKLPTMPQSAAADSSEQR